MTSPSTRSSDGRAPRRHRPCSRAIQSGVTLIIAMVMLVIIGFAAVSMMRNALGTDQVALGVRSQAQALQYAQAALHWCEMRWQSGAPSPEVAEPAIPERWSRLSNWQGSAPMARAVTRQDLSATGTGVSFPAHAPQCLMERRSLPDGQAVVVTARGMSLDYGEDARGRVQSGSAVWVQSVTLLPAAAPGASAPVPASGPRAWRQLVTPPST